MFKNYVKIAFRNVVRNKGYSFINIFGLAVGLTVCILIMLWVQDEYNCDRYHDNLDNIYRVNIRYDQTGTMMNHRATPPAMGQALQEEFSEFQQYGRLSTRSDGVLVKYEESAIKENVNFADPANQII